MIGFFLLAEGASSANTTSIFAPTSPPADSIRSLFILVLAITGSGGHQTSSAGRNRDTQVIPVLWRG